MDTNTVQKLQNDLLEIVTLLPIDPDQSAEALKIIDRVQGHINHKIKINNELTVTILDCIIRCDSQNHIRLQNASLLQLEQEVRRLGGKTSQELGETDPWYDPWHGGWDELHRLLQEREQLEQELRILGYQRVIHTTSLALAALTFHGMQRSELYGYSPRAGALWSGFWAVPIFIGISAFAVYPKLRPCRPIEGITSVILSLFCNNMRNMQIGLYCALGAGFYTMHLPNKECIKCTLIAGIGAILSVTCLRKLLHYMRI